MPGVLGEMKSPDRSSAAPSIGHRTVQSVLTALAFLPQQLSILVGKGCPLRPQKVAGAVGPSTSAELQKSGETRTKKSITMCTAGQLLLWQLPPLLSAPCLTHNAAAQHHLGCLCSRHRHKGTECLPEQKLKTKAQSK